MPPTIHAMRLACEDAFRPYLRQVLEQNPPERHAHLQSQFGEHMDFLADFCLRGYPGAGGLTVEFIKGLHRAMFPPGYRQEVTTRDGHKIWMVPGEFKTVSNNVCDSYLHPGKVNVFLPSEQVPAAMQVLVARINAERDPVVRPRLRCYPSFRRFERPRGLHPGRPAGRTRRAADIPLHRHQIRRQARFDVCCRTGAGATRLAASARHPGGTWPEGCGLIDPIILLLGAAFSLSQKLMDFIDEHQWIVGKSGFALKYASVLLFGYVVHLSLAADAHLAPYFLSLFLFWILRGKIDYPSHVLFVFIPALLLGRCLTEEYLLLGLTGLAVYGALEYVVRHFRGWAVQVLLYKSLARFLMVPFGLGLYLDDFNPLVFTACGLLSMHAVRYLIRRDVIRLREGERT